MNIICSYCNQPISRSLKNLHLERGYTNHFCSRICMHLFTGKSIKIICEQCSKSFFKQRSKMSPKNFCSNSCSAKYNNKLKRKSKRSKCETLLYQLIKIKFPNLTILPNDKTMLEGLEVDIAIPSLKLAIEWNGIVHFKPIYGEEKLKSIKKIDATKLSIANNKDINLIVIPDLISTEKFVHSVFKEISDIIQSLTPPTGVEPVLQS